MKFAVWILVIAAGLSLLALLAAEMLPKGANQSRLYSFLVLDDPFRSWWFRALLGVLSLSLFVCVVERAGLLIRQAFSKSFHSDPVHFTGMAMNAKLTLTDGDRKTGELLKKLGFTVSRQESDGKILYSGVRGGLSRLGPLLTHTGMFLLIIGGLVVSLTTYKTRVLGVPGQFVEQPEWNFRLKIDDFKIIYYPVGLNMWVETTRGQRGRVETVKGDSAKVSFGAPPNEQRIWFRKSDLKTDFMISDGGGSMPFQGNIKSYMTSVTVLKGDQELYKRHIEVNSPLRESGYRFYQSSFQSMPSTMEVDSVILHCEGEGGHNELRLRIGSEPVALPWGGYSVAVPQFFSDFRMDEQFHPFSASNEMKNPAARVELFQNGSPIGASWVFARSDAHMGGNLPITFKLVDLAGVRRGESQFATILEVTKEGGRPIVWAGFLIMTLGLMLAYVTSHRQAWGIVVKKGDGREEVYLAATSQRDAEHFRRIWDEHVAGLS